MHTVVPHGPRGSSASHPSDSSIASDAHMRAQDNTLKGPWSFRAKEQVICMCEGARRGSPNSPPMPPKFHLALSGSSFPPGEHRFPDPTCLAAPPQLALGQPGPWLNGPYFWLVGGMLLHGRWCGIPLHGRWCGMPLHGRWCGMPLHGGTHGLVACLGSWVMEGEAPI